MIETTIKTTEVKMDKALEALKSELTKLRTGRASVSLLDHLVVSCYGSDMPISQLATISVVDARTLSVTPWDKSNTQNIERAIMMSELGLNPVTAGEVIRIPLPPLTEDRRKELVKMVKETAERSRVSLRAARRDANTELKDLEKDKAITEDELRKAEDRIQKITDDFNQKVDEVIAAKEKDLMEI